ncbi:hypothetical protein NQ318_018732 [Aromia moschata]|uniref:Chitin-binding type-4 domain-containing protein n=1 Tax=Aromia moschata TaxID=1265417 RepID=A0AAV8ZH55_9CUCU|nr:hypothetical protein NQ318_018732 [Aromia moschata]
MPPYMLLKDDTWRVDRRRFYYRFPVRTYRLPEQFARSHHQEESVLSVAMHSDFLIVVAALLLREALGHGMMLDPPNRASRWRFNASAPADYDDNQCYCGGAGNQYGVNGGKCGVCGDPYQEPHPQAHENTGKYGEGVVVAEYASGSTIDVTIKLTANHLGHFEYSVCPLEDPDSPEPGEDCFRPLILADGTSQYPVLKEQFDIKNTIKLPEMECDRCVLRWHYTAGNSWGQCEDGTYAEGCGPQETFRSCSDIAIH